MLWKTFLKQQRSCFLRRLGSGAAAAAAVKEFGASTFPLKVTGSFLVISRKALSENENTGPAMCQNTPITMDKKKALFFFRIYPILHSVSIETHSLTDPGFVPLKEAAIKVPSHLCACASVCVSSGVNVESAVFPMKIFILERVANIQD